MSEANQIDTAAILADCEWADLLVPSRDGHVLAKRLAAHCRALVADNRGLRALVAKLIPATDDAGPGIPAKEVFDPLLVLAALRERAKALEAELNPPGKYKCGCRAVRSDKIKLFCPAHHKILEDDLPVPDRAPGLPQDHNPEETT